VPTIELQSIDMHVCHGLDLVIEDKEFLVLLGPNGAGKTTVLSVIAGLAAYKGSVFFDGRCMDRVPPNRRGVSYLPQNLVLFPHMTVAGNIAYGLRARGWEAERVQRRVEELLHLMHLEQLRERHPKQLSGGERQRAALARALAPSPDILLLDEPLASVDLQTAKRVRGMIREVHGATGLTTVYVTHSLEEAEELGDRVAFLRDGSLQQVGPPREVFFYPRNEQVAEFIGTPNILECDECREVGHGVAEVSCGSMKILVPHEGSEVKRIAFLPSDTFLSTSRPPGPELNRFVGKVVSIVPGRTTVHSGVAVGETVVFSEISPSLCAELDLSEGVQVHLILKLRRIRTYERQSCHRRSAEPQSLERRPSKRE